jgi:hypothetical protein
MSPEQLEIALHKLINTMLIKNRVDFKMMVNKDFNFFDSLSYTVSMFITVDHGKYWENSPNHSEEYTNYINELEDDSDNIESLIPYVINDGDTYFNLKWEHYNTDAYEPFLDYLGEEGLSYVVHFTEYRPNIEIAMGINDRNKSLKREDISGDFDTDNMILYWDDIS